MSHNDRDGFISAESTTCFSKNYSSGLEKEGNPEEKEKEGNLEEKENEENLEEKEEIPLLFFLLLALGNNMHEVCSQYTCRVGRL